MLHNKLVVGILAISGASGVALKDAETDWTLRKLNKNVGNVKWQRPHEKEHFDLDSILGDFYGQAEDKFNRKVDYTPTKVRYTDPNPYTYEVTRPTIQYREAEHVRPDSSYKTPVRNYDHEHPEGFVNEYLGYDLEEYSGLNRNGSGSDHEHFNFDNVDLIDVSHSHEGPFPFERQHKILPEAENFFVPVIVDPEP